MARAAWQDLLWGSLGRVSDKDHGNLQGSPGPCEWQSRLTPETTSRDAPG